MKNILCKIGLHNWKKLVFWSDEPYITRTCYNCNKHEDMTFWNMSIDDRLRYILWACLPIHSNIIDIMGGE